MIPILEKHDPTKIIGVVYSDGEQLKVRFTEDQEITKEMFSQIFGNVSYMIDECDTKYGDDETIIIKTGTIVAFAL